LADYSAQSIVVAADNPTTQETFIITAYVPDLTLWEIGFKKKKDAKT